MIGAFFIKDRNMVFTKNGHTDFLAVMALIDAFSEKSKVKIRVREEDLYALMNRIQVPCKDGVENANIFKKASTFLCDFVNGGVGMIESIENNNILPTAITKIRNYESAFIGFFIVCVFLRDATVNKDNIIEHSIMLSAHSHADIIDALSNITLHNNFKLVAVLLEQLVYKNNPDLQYHSHPIN